MLEPAAATMPPAADDADRTDGSGAAGSYRLHGDAHRGCQSGAAALTPIENNWRAAAMKKLAATTPPARAGLFPANDPAIIGGLRRVDRNVPGYRSPPPD